MRSNSKVQHSSVLFIIININTNCLMEANKNLKVFQNTCFHVLKTRNPKEVVTLWLPQSSVNIMLGLCRRCAIDV